MACEDGDAKVKGKLPYQVLVQLTEGKAAGLLGPSALSLYPWR